ncbi:RNA polymerase sigma factor [Streptomyces sp. NPDC004031]
MTAEILRPDAEAVAAPAEVAPAAPVRTETAADPGDALLDPADTLDPEAAFDALYLRCAGPLRRQVVVLTGDAELAAEAVRRAFDQAWQRWPEVARDSDPAGWLRATAHTYALAPWQRHWKRVRRRPPVPAPEDGLWRALVGLHPERRRALLLHDGLGMSLVRTAAEVESSPAAAASRIIGARRELAAAAPDAYDGGDAAEHLGGLLAAVPEPPPAPDGAPEVPARAAGVREASERGTRRRTLASFAAAGTVLLVTTVGMIVGPSRPGASHHHDPVPPHGQAARTAP